ncbi:FAD/NAD(P)-binding domain-containing protein [Cryphonectria parasitica EP155]|uniref:FAD/NAD(P)-binding domain-containing protein n=1 Tax=Cryphonectria parasitica (strain ATCC 38755 / EP155) TaxID=660469 RepID=A0A9P4YBC6_CRYP1|nr:FAD/NAD(P)-binding domain-containing protein [Cryphonectria parasitica EP155]KAF3769782.1 FAD/NAD(P)-binding domain-containing protein [Cryphonectria parasitica EP155]
MASQASSLLQEDWDVLVIGGGNAGFSAATSAAETLLAQHDNDNNTTNPRVLLIDKCPESWAGGNSYFTAGAMRCVHAGLSDVLPLVNNVDAELATRIDLAPYTPDDFLGDLHRVTDGRYNRALGRRLVDDSRETVGWLAAHGVRFQLSFNRQAYQIGDRFKFWGGMCLKTEDGGKGLIEDHKRAAAKAGVTVVYETAAKRIVTDPATGKFEALEVVRSDGTTTTIRAKAVILAAGGFESNPRMRAQYLGHGWDLGHVRGTPYNTGEVLEMAIRDLGAKQAGHWSGCHSVAWDADSPADTGSRETSNEFTKSGYPLGITLNRTGERFFDEGSDIRNYTYAKFGKAILGQPGGVAFQVWDGQGIPWLRSEEYRDEVVRKVYGDTIEELAAKLEKSEGLESAQKFVDTVKEYNEAVSSHRQENQGLKWDPSVKDGLSTQSSTKSLRIPKSNWALPLTQGPFMAIKVCCGVTFTFGGLAVDPETSAVISSATGAAMPGVFCCGEMLGGLFYENYPGGSGLTSGATFGRRAGLQAAALVRK